MHRSANPWFVRKPNAIAGEYRKAEDGFAVGLSRYDIRDFSFVYYRSPEHGGFHPQPRFAITLLVRTANASMNATADFQIAREVEDDQVRLILLGDLDLESRPALEAELSEARETHRTVVLDLSRLGFIDCAGLEAIINADQDAQGDGWNLRVESELAPAVRHLFDLTGAGAQIMGLPRID